MTDLLTDPLLSQLRALRLRIETTLAALDERDQAMAWAEGDNPKPSDEE